MIWLGSARGYLTDWTTQLWVKVTGRRVDFAQMPWLDGPIASTAGIEARYFEQLAATSQLTINRNTPDAGILPDFAVLQTSCTDLSRVDPAVRHFYEHTAGYELDAWAEWSGFLRPFGWLLAVLFSRRLRQLNVPLSALDTSRGLTSEVLQFTDTGSGEIRATAWFRRLQSTGNVLYAGFYGVCRLPGREDPCVKVVFPLPNGNAVVIMYVEIGEDGAFLLTSAGDRFGDPGFYFTVRGPGNRDWARYVRALRETIRVYPAENKTVRADHILKYFGATFLRLHYRMRLRPGA